MLDDCKVLGSIYGKMLLGEAFCLIMVPKIENRASRRITIAVFISPEKTIVLL